MEAGYFAVARKAQPINGALYRDEVYQGVTVDLGFAYIGDVQLELIQPCDEQRSVHREALDRGVTGLHHYCCLVEDYDACYERALVSGYQPVVTRAGRVG